MKKPSDSHRFGGLVLALLGSILISSCASSSPQSRIEQNPKLFADLSAKDRVLVQRGVIREGMTKNAVFLSWGTPDQTAVGRRSGRETENWTYLGQRPIRTVSMNMGYGFGYGGFGYGGYGGGPWGYGGGPFGGFGPWGYGGPGMVSNVAYVPYTAGTVSFRSGRVTEWSAASH